MTDVSPATTVATTVIEPPVTDEPIVAYAGRYYRNMRYLMTLGLLIFAGFFAYDGFVRYPAINAKIAEVNLAYDNAKTDVDRAALGKLQHDLGAPHSDTDIALQKKLAFLLPVVAAGFLIFILRRSRGEIRLENGLLHAPGHPPIAMSAITSIDSTLWKKKGIAVVNYSDNGKTAALRLDDFIYQQKPIDAIYDRLVAARA